MFAVTILSVNTPPPPPPSRMARARLLSIIGRVINRRRLITFKVNTSAAYREGRWSVCENGVHIRRRQHKKKDEIETLTGIHLVNQQVSFVKLRDGASGKVGHQETGLLRSEGAGNQQLWKKVFVFLTWTVCSRDSSAWRTFSFSCLIVTSAKGEQKKK